MTAARHDSTGQLERHFLKWSLERPIQFHISIDTPVEYREAVKEGVLYWNLAFGKNVLEVFDAPFPVRAPHPSYNVIQWVQADAATTSYADWSADPRTGEIRHAQIFLSSGAVLAAEELLRKEEREKYSLSAHLEKHFNAIDGQDLTERLKDAVRVLTAHEVGHALGLKHNFAASVYAKTSIQQRNALFEDYAVKGNRTAAHDAFVTSSVMDYHDPKSDLLIGAQIKAALQLNGDALPHDRHTIEWLYLGGQDDDAPVFCTDEDKEKYADCNQFDFGNPVAFERSALAAFLSGSPIMFAEGIIAAKLDALSVNRLPVSISLTASSFQKFLSWFKDSTQSNLVESQFFHNGMTQNNAIREAKANFVKKSVEDLGGVENTAFFFLPPFRNSEAAIWEMKTKLDDFLAHNYQGFGQNGKPFYFTPQEVEWIRSEGEELFRRLEENLLDSGLIAMGSLVVDIPALGLQFESALAEVAAHIILATKGGPSLGAQGKLGPMTLDAEFPEFVYPFATRKKAVALLHAQVLQEFDWSGDIRRDIQGKLKGMMHAEDVSIFRTSPHYLVIRKWILEQRAVLQLLG